MDTQQLLGEGVRRTKGSEARRYNLLAANLKPAIGERLYLRTKASAQPKLALDEKPALNSYASIQSTEKKTNSGSTQFVAAKWVEHRVSSKETIYAIAKRYDVRIDDLVKWNNLGGYDLKTGQQLKIYK